MKTLRLDINKSTLCFVNTILCSNLKLYMSIAGGVCRAVVPECVSLSSHPASVISWPCDPGKFVYFSVPQFPNW